MDQMPKMNISRTKNKFKLLFFYLFQQFLTTRKFKFDFETNTRSCSFVTNHVIKYLRDTSSLN